MTTVRITEFHARSEGEVERLAELLEIGARVYRRDPACSYCRVLQREDAPTQRGGW